MTTLVSPWNTTWASFIFDFFCGFNSFTCHQLFVVHRNLLSQWGWPGLCPGRSKGWEWTGRRRWTRSRWFRRTGNRRRTGKVLCRCDWGTSRYNLLAAVASWLKGSDKLFFQWMSLAKCTLQRTHRAEWHHLMSDNRLQKTIITKPKILIGDTHLKKKTVRL